MASIRDICDGLAVLSKYAKPMASGAKGLDVHIGGADHDVIYGPCIDEPSSEDKGKLEILGWHFDDDFECWCRFV